MSRLPRMTGGRLISVLQKAGFKVIRVRGSHHRLRHPDGRRTVVPVHGQEEIGPGLLFRILHECDMSRDDLEELR
jgi:predicted RNA binding protein YcfA (HicA-like mRNA interferase family)